MLFTPRYLNSTMGLRIEMTECPLDIMCMFLSLNFLTANQYLDN